MKRLSVACVAACALTCANALAAHAQRGTTNAAPVRLTLGKPELVTAAEFTFINSAVRFANGNMLVADAVDHEIKLVNGRTGAVRVVGRTGSGPGEYRQASRVFAWPGNTAVLLDGQLKRATQYDANGVALRSSPMPMYRFGFDFSVSVDRAGRVYFVESEFDELHGTPASMQTVARWQWGERNGSAVTTVQAAPYHIVESAKGKERRTYQVPYANADAFAVLSDGTQVVARAAARVVEWRDSTGRVLASTRFPGAPVAITDSAKALWKPAELRTMIGRWYPPFSGFMSALSTNDRLWLRTLPERADSTDWIGFRRGESTPQTMRLPRSAYVLAVAEPYLIVMKPGGGDDLRRLEVYRLPK